MDLLIGFQHALSINNLFYCFLGCAMGTLVGVLPGLGPSSTLAILLPLTLNLDATGSIIMLSGIYYGAAYGGSTTSILVNIPGEAGSVPACFDGFPMTKQGRAGKALFISAVGSFIAGTFGVSAIIVMGPFLVKHALKFGPPEYFGLLLFSLSAIVSLAGRSIIKGLACGLFGMILATVGVDTMVGIPRFTFGSYDLMMGLGLVPLVVGLFGIGEVISSIEAGVLKIYEGRIGGFIPKGKEMKMGLLGSLRGTIVGFFPGLLPGMIPALTAFFAYDVEKRFSKYPEKFGSGVIEGVAGPEAANNATAQAGFIPLMIFGIPTGPSMAILLGAFILHGLQPGPALFTQNKEFVWAVIASMYVGNVMLVILNLPLVGLWAKISTIPYRYMGPVILAVCVVAAYSVRNAMLDVWVAFGAGIFGHMMKKGDWPIAPLILGFILGDMLETSFRQSLSIGGPMILFTRPVPLVFIILTIVTMVMSIVYLKRVSKTVLGEVSDT
jgi:putative tricarboxylic transport membrane protein